MKRLMRFSILMICLCHSTQANNASPYQLLSVTPILQALELKHYQLPNGLQVAIVEDATRPVVTCQMNYRVGSADEPPKRQGLAHLVEHLLHDAVFLDQLNLQGGRHSNASTSQDGTRYYATIPKYLLTQVLDHFSRDLVFFDVTPEQFEIEKDVVLAEANSRYNQAKQVVNHQMIKHVFAGHPYQYPVLGTHKDSILAFTLEMAQQFHKQYYVPNNACLVVVGDVQAQTVMADVVKFFGKIPSGQSNERHDVFVPTFTRVTQDTVIYQNDAREPTVWTVWPSPPANHPDRIPLSLLDKVLEMGGSSPLDQALHNSHLVLSYRLSLAAQKEGGWIYHEAVVAPNVTPEAVTAVLNKTIRNVIDSLSDRRMQVVHNYARKDLYAMITSQPSLAGVIGYSFIYTNDPTHRIRWMQTLDQVSKADIQRVAKTYLVDQPMRQFVLTKPLPPPSWFGWPEKIILFCILMTILFLLFKYYQYKRSLLVGGIVLCLWGTSAYADISNHKIYYQYDPRVPQTEVSLIYATGGRIQEPVGKTGLLFALERLLYDRIRADISPHFDRLGAYVQFRVSDLDVTVKIRVFSENLDETLMLVHTLLEDLHFDDDALNQNRTQIMSVFEKYVDNKSLSSVLIDRLFSNKENRRIGTRQGIARVTADDLNTYVLKTRQAKVLYFKVVSDLDKAQIEKSLKIFTDRRLQDGFSPHPKPKRDTIDRRSFTIVPIVKSQVDYCYGVTNALSRQSDLWFAQLVMVEALNRFLFYKLREQKGWCYGAGVSLETQFSPPAIKFYANPPGEHTEQLVAEMYRLIGAFHEDPEFWQQVEKSKARLKQAYFLKYDLGQVLNHQIEFDRDGILPVSVEAYERAIDWVSKEDVNRVIQEVLNFQGFQTGGLQMLFFGEKKRLHHVVKRCFPNRKIEYLESSTLKEEVN